MKAIGLLLAVLLLLPILSNASAAAIPQICNVTSSSSGQTASASFTTAQSSTAFIISMSGCSFVGEVMVFSFWNTITTNGGSPVTGLTVTDNLTDTWTADAFTQMLRCTTTNSGTNCPSGNVYATPLYSFSTATVSAPGHIQVTIHSTANYPYNGVWYVGWLFITGLPNNMSQSQCVGSESFDTAGTPTLVPPGGQMDSCQVNAPANGMVYMAQLATTTSDTGVGPSPPIGTMSFQPNNSNSYNINGNNCGGHDHTCYQAAGGQVFTSSGTPSFGQGCQGDCNGISFAFIVIAFGNPSVAPGLGTTNSDWNPSSQSTISGGTYLSTKTVYFYQDANGQSSPGTVFNFTTYVPQVDCAKIFCYLFWSVYIATNPQIQPSQSNLLMQGTGGVIPIKNATSPGLESVSVPGNALVVSNTWWAIAIMSNSTASRTSGVTGTGVKVADSFQIPDQMYDTAATSTTLPMSMSGVPTTPALYFKAGLTFPVSTTTSTTTTTITTGSYTATVTSLNSTTINNSSPTNPGYWYFPIFFMGAYWGIFTVIAMYLRRTPRG